MNRKVIVVMTIDDTGVTLKDKFDRVCDHNNTVAWFQEKIRDNTEDDVLPYNLVLTIN